MKPIGYQIYSIRQTQGLGQKELALRAGIPQPNLSNLEKGKRDVTVQTLLRIARALKISPALFFTEEPVLRPALSRMRAEKMARAFWQGSSNLGKADKENVRYLRAVIPRMNAKPSGGRAAENAWIELRQRFSASEIKLLQQRVYDEGFRQGRHLP